MIFPDLPRRRNFFQSPDSQVISTVPEEPVVVSQVSVDEWFHRHFPDQARAALPHSTGPVRFSDDPWGYIKLFSIFLFLIVWAGYWHQFH